MACRFAIWPTMRSPPSVSATIDGVVRDPSELGMTTASPPSITATHEFVVPRSIPITLPMVPPRRSGLPAAGPARRGGGRGGDHHRGRADQALVEVEPTLLLLDDGAGRGVGGLDRHERLVRARIEPLALRGEALHAEARQGVLEQALRHLHPARERVVARRRRERALEAVEDGQDLLHQPLVPVPLDLVLLARRPLLVVLEGGRRAQQPIVLLLELLEDLARPLLAHLELEAEPLLAGERYGSGVRGRAPGRRRGTGILGLALPGALLHRRERVGDGVGGDVRGEGALVAVLCHACAGSGRRRAAARCAIVS